jgi:hypothetical protein
MDDTRRRHQLPDVATDPCLNTPVGSMIARGIALLIAGLIGGALFAVALADVMQTAAVRPTLFQ